MNRRVLLLIVMVVVPVVAHAGVNRWTSGGPEGGLIRSLAVDPANAAHVYAGTEAGVYRSVDGGETWQPFSDGLQSPSGFLPSVTAFAFASTVPPAVYAAAGKRVFRRSAGASGWTATSAMGPLVGSGTVYTLAVDPTNPNTIYAGVDGGVYKSTDAGASWIWANNGFSCYSVLTLAIDPANPAILYAGACGGVYRSSDGGASWIAADGSLPLLGAYALAVDPQSNAYAGTTDGVFRSANRGASWTRASNGLPPFSQIDALEIDPASPSTLYAGTSIGETFKSVNGGASWSKVDTGRVRVYALAASSSRVFSGTSTGVFRSDDGGALWSFASRGITARSVGALAIDGATPPALYAVDIDGSVLRSTNVGASWASRSTGIAGWVLSLAVDPAAPNTLYAGTEDGIFKSVDGGNVWSPTGLSSGFSAETLVIARSNPATLYASDGRFKHHYKTTNGGATWTFLGSINGRILAVDPSNAAVVYAAGGFAGMGALKSVDGGTSWTAINAGLETHPGQYVNVNALTVDPINPSTLYCGTISHGVFKSVDGGANWTAINEGLPTDFDLRALLVRTIVVDPTSSSVVYVATDSSGVFRSYDGGATWRPMNDGLTSGLVHALVIDATGKSLHAATYTGLFDLEIVARRRRAVSH